MESFNYVLSIFLHFKNWFHSTNIRGMSSLGKIFDILFVCVSTRSNLRILNDSFCIKLPKSMNGSFLFKIESDIKVNNRYFFSWTACFATTVHLISWPSRNVKRITFSTFFPAKTTLRSAVNYYMISNIFYHSNYIKFL